MSTHIAKSEWVALSNPIIRMSRYEYSLLCCGLNLQGARVVLYHAPSASIIFQWHKFNTMHLNTVFDIIFLNNTQQAGYTNSSQILQDAFLALYAFTYNHNNRESVAVTV